MWFEGAINDTSPRHQRRIERLQQAHRAGHGTLLIVLTVAMAAFIIWANVFHIDEVARAGGEVITTGRSHFIVEAAVFFLELAHLVQQALHFRFCISVVSLYHRGDFAKR